MNLEQLLIESAGGLTIYAVFRTSIMAIETGKASEAQKQLVNSFKQVLFEYKEKALLEQMDAEAVELLARQREYKEKWGSLPSGTK